ncbi:MAG: tRNA pseudouridine(13) synthase TruD [Candidatus Korarchaeota archaeon]
MPYSSELDKYVGISTTLHRLTRKKCSIKNYPESFIVEEVLDINHIARAICESEIPPTGDRGIWRFVLVKKNMDTLEAIEKIRNHLKIPHYLIGFCGLKDKDALTAQYVTVSGITPDKFKSLKCKNMFFRDFEKVSEGLYRSAHMGNFFRIILFMEDREIPQIPNTFAIFTATRGLAHAGQFLILSVKRL